MKKTKELNEALWTLAKRTMSVEDIHNMLIGHIAWDGDCSRCPYNNHNCQEDCKGHILKEIKVL